MPLALTYEEPQTFRIRVSGLVTFDEMERMIRVLEQDPHMRGALVLTDAREASDAPSSAELREIAVHAGRLAKNGLGPVAIVVGTTFLYGIARMFATFAEAVCMKVNPFRTMPEAEEWLAREDAARKKSS